MLDKTTSPDNIDNIDKNDNQSDRGINLILNHLLTEMKKILLKKFHQLENL